MKITAVNDRHYSSDVILEEIRSASSSGSLELLVANGKSLSRYNSLYR